MQVGVRAGASTGGHRVMERLISKCPPAQLIHPSSLCVNVIKVVYSVDKWPHSALQPDLLISC